MPKISESVYKIESGDTLSGVAKRLGTTVEKFMKANTQITNRDKIYAGQSLVIPLATARGETPTGDISGKLEPESVTGGLGNFRVALKAALNEAGQARSAARITQLYPAAGGVPGTMGDIARMIKGSVAPPVESVFTSIMKERDKTRDFAYGMMGSHPDAGILETDDPETVAYKASISPSFLESLTKSTGDQSTQTERAISDAQLRLMEVVDTTSLPEKGGGYVTFSEYLKIRATTALNTDSFDSRFSAIFLNSDDNKKLQDLKSQEISNSAIAG